MARIPQADFGGTRFQGRAQSRQYNPVTAKSERKKIEEQKRILLREQEIKNREQEREFQMESLELESKQTVESTAQKIALEIEGHALKAQQLYARQDLQSEQEVEKDIYQQEASANRFQLKQEADIFSNRLAQEQALLDNKQQIKRTAFEYNQTNQRQVFDFKQTNARTRLATESQLSSSQTQLIGNTINTLLSFAGSVVQYSSDMDKLNKVEEAKNLSRSYMSNRNKGADLSVLNADEDLNRTELAGEQAIRNVEATEVQRSELRNVNAGGAANRARRATSTRDLGIRLPGLAKDVIAKGGIILGPNGIPIDIKNPQSHSDVNAIALYAARTAYDNNSGGLSGLDSAEAVRSLRQQFDNTVTHLSSSLSAKFETKRSGNREFAFQNNFYSKATEGRTPQQQMFNKLKDDYILNGESLSSASKKARETMFNFYDNRNDNTSLDIFKGVQQVEGQAGTEMINVMGDELRTATADTFSDDNTANKNKFETINKDIETGEIEVAIKGFEILGTCKELPMPVFSDQEYAEEIRLKYRFLDLRRKKIHENIILRSKVISFIRDEMLKLGFLEFQTPILTSSSPEGARDFLVPSRLNPGKFYALPQAPQQFKQLIMVSGFDKYFQIAPCFRDEDARADRSPGEFYQLDLEMSFVEQEDVFNVVETLMVNTFKKFSNKKLMYDKFPKISYADAMLNYGSDKPDLRNPLLINDITEIFTREDVTFEIFKKLVKSGSKVRCISTKNTKHVHIRKI